MIHKNKNKKYNKDNLFKKILFLEQNKKLLSNIVVK